MVALDDADAKFNYVGAADDAALADVADRKPKSSGGSLRSIRILSAPVAALCAFSDTAGSGEDAAELLNPRLQSRQALADSLEQFAFDSDVPHVNDSPAPAVAASLVMVVIMVVTPVPNPIAVPEVPSSYYYYPKPLF